MSTDKEVNLSGIVATGENCQVYARMPIPCIHLLDATWTPRRVYVRVYVGMWVKTGGRSLFTKDHSHGQQRLR